MNVTLNERRELTGVFAGELQAAHEAGIAQAEREYVRPIPELFDIVVSTNMGYPADLNLYQSVKGMSVAYSSMSRETTEAAHLHYCEDVAATVEELRRRHLVEHGREASIAVLPYGHLTVPRLA